MTSPWKKRGPKSCKTFPPSRALLAESHGRKSVATWCLIDDLWICKWANGFLSWMKGQSVESRTQADAIRARLQIFQWQWLVPLYIARPLQPPF